MKHKKTIVVIFIVASALFFAFFRLKSVMAETPIHEISNFDELVEAARISRESGHQKDTFVLTNNIEITEENQNQLNNSDFKYISFGSSDYPFTGTFDGRGYYISNLKYDNTLGYISDTGLFSNTATGAIIKNLTINNAEIHADYRGGIIAGNSEGTIFENITVSNSNLSMYASNSDSTVLVDDIITGGAIVGKASNCVLYNCESTGTIINSNITENNELSGIDVYLGGLVGTSIATEVEYSRVVDGLIENYYDSKTGVLGENTLYVGGIVGQMKNSSKVIDSFSTAELYYYATTYVSVGAGNSGHIGGITAAMFGTNNEICRSHYAGKATSKQYNTALSIPLIQNNVNISGIADIYEGGTVANTYFKASLNPDVKMSVLGDNTSTSSYGTLSNDRYVNEKYWQTQNYDFYGNIKRQSAYSENHTNKWSMDIEKGIPVHGGSIAATLDFSGAGKVSISSTDLVETSVSTENAYSFAVQGIKPNEFMVDISATENEGYRFISWYKVPNITVWSIEDNYSYFEDILSKYSPISNEKQLNDIWVENNDLFVAYYQAKVLFYDIDGKIIDTTTGQPIETVSENDWYNNGTKLSNVEPSSKPSENAILIGWTTTKSNESGGGYSNINFSQLELLKSNNDFYKAGDKITKTMELYPIYADVLSNINIVFEGNEQDTIDDVSKRDGVGYASAKMKGVEEVEISVVGANADGTFPAGYRFIGWFDENNIKVSNSVNYTLKDINFTVQHTYTARFEYRVDYYSTTKDDVDSEIDKNPYASIWHEYQEVFKYLGDVPLDGEDTFSHWASNSNDNCNNSSCATQIASNYNVISPMGVYSHVKGSSSYDVLITTDFPNSSTLSNSRPTLSTRFKITTVPKEGYNFIFWGFGAANGNQAASNSASWDRGTHVIARSYHYKAHYNANVIFYNKTNSKQLTATRHYNEQLFHSGITYSYTYPITNNAISDYTDFSEPSPTDSEMEVDGYIFLGWISSLEVERDSAEWNYIYDVENDLYCTSSISKARPYILKEDEVVQETMEVYPVYIPKKEIVTTTNIDSKDIITGMNFPSNPNYVITESETEKGIGVITITPDTTTYVAGNSGKKYEISSVVRIYEDGKEEEIVSNNNTYSYDVEEGKTYIFMAKYETIILKYHLNDSEISVSAKSKGEKVGTFPMPTYNNELSNNYIFMGWTVSKPTDNGYYKLETYSELENLNINLIEETTIVNDKMELWPVYVAMKIKVKSNIDEYLNNNIIDAGTVRYITKPAVNNSQLNVSNEKVGNYQFIGWYKDYESLSNKGELITEGAIALLQDTESIKDVTYTAVFSELCKVNYFNTQGEIISSIDVYKGQNRSFVTETVDANGNSVIVPIDYEPYIKINKSLKPNQFFQNWQWQQQDGTVIKWDNFYNENIVQDMNIYPIIREITATDSDNNEIDVIGSNQKEKDIILAMDSQKIYACLNIVYDKFELIMHVEDFCYKSNGEYDIEYKEGVEVSVFSNNDITNKDIATDNTDENGIVNINFFGELVIAISKLEEDSTNDLFLFEIFDINNNVVNEVIIGKGESKIVKIPYGNYTIKQKENWAWRYAQSLNETIVMNSNSFNAEILYGEERIINKWFDSMSRILN